MPNVINDHILKHVRLESQTKLFADKTCLRRHARVPD